MAEVLMAGVLMAGALIAEVVDIDALLERSARGRAARTGGWQ